jgi:hypothetical protein
MEISRAAGGKADAPRAHVPRLVAGRDESAAAGLGHRPGLDQRKAEARLEGGVVLRVGVGAVAEADIVCFLMRGLGLAEKDGRHHPKVMNNGGARVGDVPPPVLRMEPVQLHHAARGEDHRGGRYREGVHVEERQRRDGPLLAVPDGAQAALVEIALPDVEEVEVAEQAAFRLASGAGGIEQGAFAGVAGFARLGQILQRLRVDQRARFAVLEHVGELRRAVIRVERHHARTEGVEGEEMQGEFRAVLQLQRNAVAAAVAARAVARRNLADALARLGIGKALAVGGEFEERLAAVGRRGLFEGRMDCRHFFVL